VRGEWNDTARQVLLDSRTRQRGIVDPPAVDQLLRDHASGRTEGGDRIWTLMNLELWYRTFVDGDGRWLIESLCEHPARAQEGPAVCLQQIADGLALAATRAGGTVVCAGIHMSDIPSFPYADLWGERRIESVANLTREDGARFMEMANNVALRTEVTTYPLEKANAALADLRQGRLGGAAVLVP